MSFIKECLKGNGTIRSIIVALIVAIVIVPVLIKGCVAEHNSYVKHYNEEVKELQK